VPEDATSEVVRLDDGDQDMELLRRVAEECGADVERAGVRSSIDPGVLLAIVTGGTATVALTLERWRDRRQGGQVIDLRPGATNPLRRDRGVLYGYVVVLLKDGRVEVHLKEPANHLAELVQHVVSTCLGAASDSGDGDGATGLDHVADLIKEIATGESTVQVHRDDPSGHGGAGVTGQ
jgi:hypothetical protein